MVAELLKEQQESLSKAIHSHDFLHRVLREIENLHRVVFHANPRADWNGVRKSAEQILIAEIWTRHRGEIDGIYNALREMERSGKEWRLAIRELAGRIHSYFTTPLGLMMRSQLFGDDAAYLSPDAKEYLRLRAAAPNARNEDRA